MHDCMPYGRNQGQRQGHWREVDCQSPTGLIFLVLLSSFGNRQKCVRAVFSRALSWLWQTAYGIECSRFTHFKTQSPLTFSAQKSRASFRPCYFRVFRADRCHSYPSLWLWRNLGWKLYIQKHKICNESLTQFAVSTSCNLGTCGANMVCLLTGRCVITTSTWSMFWNF